MNFQLTRPLCFFDLETTGTSVAKDRIVQIAVRKVFPDGTHEDRATLLNPEMPIPEEAAAVHGITDEMVQDKPTFKRIAKSLHDFMAGCDLAGYNILHFDIPLLVESFMRAGIDTFPHPDVSAIDAFNIFRKKEPRDLSAAMKFYCQKEMDGAHDAHNDTKATHEILLAQLQHYQDLKEMNFTEVAEFCRPDQVIVDYAGKITIDKDGDYAFAFGKHKGAKCKHEPKYLTWMLSADDFTQNTKAVIQKILSEI